MPVNKHRIVAAPTAVCFGCNQSFAGNPVGFRYETDLVGERDRAELAGLVFHEGHLFRYAHRRGWTALVDELTRLDGTRF